MTGSRRVDFQASVEETSGGLRGWAISKLYHHFTHGGMSRRDVLDRLTELVFEENPGIPKAV
jgi:hypothetical protein